MTNVEDRNPTVTRGLRRIAIVLLTIMGLAEIVLGLRLVRMTADLPSSDQIASTFELARTANRRALYAAELLDKTMTRLREIPIIGKEIPSDWIHGTKELQAEIAKFELDLGAYQRQAVFTSKNLSSVCLLVSAIVFAHAAYVLTDAGARAFVRRP